MEKLKIKLTPSQAWQDFHSWVRQPEVWRGISVSGRDQIGKAERAYHTGLPFPLRDARIESLLSRFALDRYRIEKHVVFYLNNP